MAQTWRSLTALTVGEYLFPTKIVSIAKKVVSSQVPQQSDTLTGVVKVASLSLTLTYAILLAYLIVLSVKISRIRSAIKRTPPRFGYTQVSSVSVVIANLLEVARAVL